MFKVIQAAKWSGIQNCKCLCTLLQYFTNEKIV